VNASTLQLPARCGGVKRFQTPRNATRMHLDYQSNDTSGQLPVV
jgi:hypothetical protein